MSAKISFVCRTEGHQDTPTAIGPSSPVTLHDGVWAYCPLGAVDGHAWEPVEDIEVEALRHRLGNDQRRGASSPS